MSQAPYFRYKASDIEHEVWFGDARSAQASYALAAELGLRGMAYWNLMRPYTVAWTVAASEYDIIRPLETIPVSSGNAADAVDAVDAVDAMDAMDAVDAMDAMNTADTENAGDMPGGRSASML